MLAVLTGATGFLGRRVLRGLIDAGWTVRCAVRPASDVDLLRNSVGAARWDHVQIVPGNLSDSGYCQSLVAGGNVVLHLAAALSGCPSSLIARSVVPTRTLTQAAADAGIQRLVLVSSLGVYGSQGLPRWSVLDETVPLDSRPFERDPYTYSKILQEEAAWRVASEQTLPLVVIRPGVIYGDERGLLSDRVGLRIGKWLLRMGGRRPLPLTYVENCAAAIVRASLAEGIDGEVFNIVDDPLPTGSELLRWLKARGTGPRVIPVPQWMVGWLGWFNERYSDWTDNQIPRVLTRHRVNAVWKPLRFSNDRARQRLDWIPVVDFEAAALRTLNWQG